MTRDIEKGVIGSSFESFLEEEGRLEDATITAVKRVLARQIAEASSRRTSRSRRWRDA